MKYKVKIFTLFLLGFLLILPHSQTWEENGSLVSNADRAQHNPQLLGDGAGGCFIVWEDTRNITSQPDIYAQRVDQNGQLLWGANGTAICNANNIQSMPQLCGDGVGGIIVVWTEYRMGGAPQVWAQRVNSTGHAQWAHNGIPICSDAKVYFLSTEPPIAISGDAAGGAVFAWQDWRNGANNVDIFAQRVNSSGVIQWDASGVPVCTASEGQFYVDICLRDIGGAIVAWTDYRNTTDTGDIYAQKLNSAGVPQWMPNGTPVCTEANQQIFPIITRNAEGGAYIVWQDKRNGIDYDIYGDSLDQFGDSTWTLGVSRKHICNLSNDQMYPQLARIATVDFIVVTWEDKRSGEWDIYAQVLEKHGQERLISNGIPVCNAPDSQTMHQLSINCTSAAYSAGMDGAVVSWIDSRSGDEQIYAQKISCAGEMKWKSNGVAVCTRSTIIPSLGVSVPQICSDGLGGAIIVWEDYVSASNGDLYIAHIHATGGGGIPGFPLLYLIVGVLAIISIYHRKKFL